MDPTQRGSVRERPFAVDDAETRAVDHVVAFFFAALFVHDGDQARTIHGDGSAAATFDVFEVHELDAAVVAGFKSGTLGYASSGSADVESTHGELRAGFADGLRGDNADSFAEFHHATGGQVTPVAECANAATRFASQHGTDMHSLDTRALHGVGELFGDFLIDLDDYAALEVLDLVERNAANDAVAQWLDFVAGFDDGLDENAVGGAAIALVDDYVLRHVHEAASEVTGVGGLERGVSQTLTRTVSGDEILQHVQAFAEV